MVESLGPAVRDHSPSAHAAPGSSSRAAMLAVSLPLTGLAVALYVLTLVLFDQNPATQRVSDVAILFLTIIFIIETIILRGKLYIPSPLVWYMLFLLFVTFQMIWSPGSINMLLSLYLLLVVSTVLVNYMVTNGYTAIYISFAIGLLCTLAYIVLSGESPEDGRYRSTLMNTNLYAWFMVLCMLIGFRSILVRMSERRLGKASLIVGACFIAVNFYGILYLSGSRKGIVISAVSSAAFIAYMIWLQPPRRRIIMSLPLLAALSLILYWVYQSPKFNRLADIANILDGGNIVDTGVIIRGQLLEDGIHLWLQRPFTGWGLDQFTAVSGWGMYAHDNYVELLANHGAIGLALYLMVFVSLMVSLARSFLRSRDPRTSAETFWAMTVVVMMLVWDLAAVSYYGRLGWTMLSVLIAVSVTARTRLESVAGEGGTAGPTSAWRRFGRAAGSKKPLTL
jgi:O-antigen ligase